MSAASEKIAETPLMKQYNAIKAKYPDAVLLFRVGDFYETFGEDAVRAAQVLGIVLTKRKNGAAAYVDLAGFQVICGNDSSLAWCTYRQESKYHSHRRDAVRKGGSGRMAAYIWITA